MERELSIEDEVFLYETFLKLSSPDYDDDDAEVFFSEDENDIPLSYFFEYEKDPHQCPSPMDTTPSTTYTIPSPTYTIPSPSYNIPSPTSPQQFFPNFNPGSPSPCGSPISLFPPTRLENFPAPYTYTPSPTTPPPIPIPLEIDSKLEIDSTPQTPNFSPPGFNLSPEYIAQPTYPSPIPDADSATVHFIDLKDLYEKAQVRRRGTSEQRLVECRVHMVTNFLTIPRDVQVWVRRYTEIKGFQNTVELPVTIEKTMLNMQYFSVNLDAVYVTEMGKKFYQLSTTDRFRKNRFVIHVNMIFEDNSNAEFKSEPFLIRSRKQSPNPRKSRSYSDC